MKAALLAILLVAYAAVPLISAPGKEGTAAAAGTTAAPVKVVYHVNDVSHARAAMRNIQNHLNADPSAKIVVVTHSKGKDAKGSYEPQVADLKNQGVTFDVCNNTLKGRD